MNQKPSRWRKRAAGLGLAVVSALLLGGCSPGGTPGQGVSRNGIWGQFVGLISDLLDFFAQWTGSYVLALLLLTLVVRLIIFPLWLRQIRSSLMMQRMGPQRAAIERRYRGDTQRIQQETMKLYQAAHVNPLMGCLPAIIQIPVFFALFRAIYENPSLYQTHFLWLSLGQRDPYYVLPILASGLTFLSQFLSMRLLGTAPGAPTTPQEAQGQQMQRMFLYIYPFMMLFITIPYQSGVALYWVFSNLLMVLQILSARFIHVEVPKLVDEEGNFTEEVQINPRMQRLFEQQNSLQEGASPKSAPARSSVREQVQQRQREQQKQRQARLEEARKNAHRSASGRTRSSSAAPKSGSAAGRKIVRETNAPPPSHKKSGEQNRSHPKKK